MPRGAGLADVVVVGDGIVCSGGGVVGSGGGGGAIMAMLYFTFNYFRVVLNTFGWTSSKTNNLPRTHL